WKKNCAAGTGCSCPAFANGIPEMSVRKSSIRAVMLLAGGMFSLVAQQPAGLESTAKAILEKRCLACHNAQMKTAGLILSSLENALKGGSKGPALVPRKPDESLIWQRISAGQMPPANPLSAEEREVIRQWIESGAPWTGVIGKAVRPRAGP